MKKRFKIRKYTVLDTRTGLEWERKHSGPMTWQKAMDYSALNTVGWRLPTIEELITLINFAKVNPASDFLGMPSEWFWSSSSSFYASNVSDAWYVSFSYGNVNTTYKSRAGYVRCVRGPKKEGE